LPLRHAPMLMSRRHADAALSRHYFSFAIFR
jgi:hypothetical protein